MNFSFKQKLWCEAHTEHTGTREFRWHNTLMHGRICTRNTDTENKNKEGNNQTMKTAHFFLPLLLIPFISTACVQCAPKRTRTFDVLRFVPFSTSFFIFIFFFFISAIWLNGGTITFQSVHYVRGNRPNRTHNYFIILFRFLFEQIFSLSTKNIFFIYIHSLLFAIES